MNLKSKIISLITAVTLVVSIFVVVPVAYALPESATVNYNFSNYSSAAEVSAALSQNATVYHTDSTLTLNQNNTVTLKKGNTACGGVVFGNKQNADIQQISGSLYLPKYTWQCGAGFVYSNSVSASGVVNHYAVCYSLGADSVGGLYIQKNYGSITVNSDGTAHIGTNNNGGGWGSGGSFYIANQSVQTTTSVSTFTLCDRTAVYSNTADYFTKDAQDNFTKIKAGTLGETEFKNNPNTFYTQKLDTVTEYNLPNPPTAVTAEKTVTENSVSFKTVKNVTGYFTAGGTKGSSITDLGMSPQDAEKVANITSVSEAERMVNYNLYYSGEDVKKPILSLTLNLNGNTVTTNETSVPFYSTHIGPNKSLGLAVINSWGRTDEWGKLTFGNINVVYAAEKSSRTLNLDTDVRYIGRYYKNGNTPTFGWEQSGFEFSFYGTGTSVTISNLKDSRAYLNAYVDGVRQTFETPSYEPTNDLFLDGKITSEFVIAKNLPEGKHTVKIIKRSGAMYNSVELNKIYIHQSENAQILPKPEAPTKKIAVFGDSISEGMGILSGGGLPSNEDPTLSYATLAIEAFGGEVCDAVAEGGIGVTQCEKTYTMSDVIDYVDYHNLGTSDQNDLYSFNSNPDAIVFNLGTNDGANWDKTTPEEFITGLKSLIKKINTHYPNKPIFYVYGMMAIGDTVKSSINTALDELQQENIKNIYFVPVSCTTQNGEITYAAHPNALGHTRVSKHLIAKMAEVLGWKTADMQKNLTVSSVPDQTFDKTAKTPEVTVTLNGKQLTENTDYLLSYQNNKNPGTAKINITLCGEYSGYASVNFKIVCPHKNLTFSTISEPTCSKTGIDQAICGYCEQIVTQIIPATGKHSFKLTTKTPAGFGKNGKIVSICSVCKTEKEEKENIILAVKTVILSAETVEYNGKTRTPTVTVKDSNGKTLVNKTDYTVSYASGRKYVGTYSVKVTLKGNYTGTKTLIFKINPKKISVKKATPGKKKVTVSWSAQKSQTTGYQIEYATNSKFKSAKRITVSSYKSKSKTISKLKSKKTYYIRIRTYKKVGKTTYYSGWSSSKKAKIK